MITLKKEGVVMQVANDLMASVFERNGYVRVTNTEGRENAGEQETVAPATQPAKEEEPVSDPTPEKPKRRRRRKTETE